MKRRLARATFAGDIRPGGVKKGDVLKIPGLIKTVEDWEPAAGAHKGKPGGFRFDAPDYPLVQPNQTASAAKLVRSGTQNGSPVGKTRPMGWWEFLALLGPGGRKKWVQGHFINRRLGGPGERKNLAPFTYSMNTVHYIEVERHVLKSIQEEHGVVSYTVHAIPHAGAGENENYCVGCHEAFLAENRREAVAAMVGCGLTKGADPVMLVSQGPAYAKWAGVTAGAKNHIRTYVRQTFPAGIVCRARYYGPAGPGVPHKRVGQVVIDNTR